MSQESRRLFDVTDESRNCREMNGDHGGLTFDDAFELLWKAYPRKVAKGAARKAVRAALRKADFDALLAAVEEFARASKLKDQQFIPYPATWFNQERWDDDRKTWWGDDYHEEAGKRVSEMTSAEKAKWNIGYIP